MSSSAQNRDIVVIGASAGGLQALSAVISQLPPDLPAALFVVQHLPPDPTSRLPELLSECSPWRALYPVHGQEIALRHIYVAPPDAQLLVRHGYVHVTRGPKENGHRPSVDALFRTAARAYGPRVIGVVLTGYLNCGTAGLMSIKARGGLAIVQDPSSASVAEMPESAILHVRVDHVAPLDELAALITRLVRAPAEPEPPLLARAVRQLDEDEITEPTEVVCPTCRGSLKENSGNEDYPQFRCRVGHTFSLNSVLAEQTEETERALWAAVRALEDSAALALRMATKSTDGLRERYAEKYDTLSQQADLMRTILLGHVREPRLQSDLSAGT